MPRLKNKVAIITGSGPGIGLAAAQSFVDEGATVIITEINEELGRSAEAQLRAAGGEAAFVRTDCACSADVQALIARTETLYGHLHVLYNNASVYLDRVDGPVTELAEETWAKILAINLNSVFLIPGVGRIVVSERGHPRRRRWHYHQRRPVPSSGRRTGE